MRRILFIFLTGLAFSACEVSLDPYKLDDYIYFDQWYKNVQLQNDTLSIAWGLKASEITEQQMTLRVCLLGNVADRDRKFNVEVVRDPSDPYCAVEGEDYLAFPLEYTLAAGKAEVSFDVTMLRPAKLLTQPSHLTVRLVETPELGLFSRQIFMSETETYRDYDIQRVIKMTENFPTPGWWNLSNYGPSIFGTWSVTKSILICDVLGIDREVWAGINLTGTLTPGYLRFAGQYMHRWLMDNPTLDEDGEPMKMGPASQV